VARKWGRPHEAGRIITEAAVLERLQHPGVVELIGVEHQEDGSAELTTAYVGPNTLADLAERGVLTVERLTRISAGAATTLADVHERGIVHGRLEPSHVLVGPGDRAVICSWGGADASPTDDVAALGALVAELLPAGEDPALARGLSGIVANATAADRGARPAMRAMAAALRALLPVERAEAHPGHPASRSHRRAGVMIAIVGIVTGAALAGAAAAGDGEPKRAAPPRSSTSTAMRSPPNPPRRVWPPSAPAAELTFGEERFAVGDARDLVTVGDWNCDGTATPAVVRRSSGTVYVFDRWPEDDAEVVGREAGRVPGARAIAAVDSNADGCDELEVTPDDGPPVTLRLHF